MGKTALVVDNDIFFVEFLTDLLEGRGYSVQKTYDGKEAILRLREGPPDLLFIDMVMPKIDGKQVIRYIQNRFPDRRFPIVAMSGAMMETNDDLQKIGADYYIAKGPMDTMAHHISGFLEKLEKKMVVESDEIMESTRLFPRQSTAELVEILDFQEGILDSIGLGLFVIDKDAMVIRVNDLGLDLIGKTLEEVLNMHVTSLVPESRKSALISALKTVALNRNRRYASFPMDAEGTRIKAIVSTFRIHQETIGWIIAMEDLREWEEPV
jgi:PAS domain S-box-containing protein